MSRYFAPAFSANSSWTNFDIFLPLLAIKRSQVHSDKKLGFAWKNAAIGIKWLSKSRISSRTAMNYTYRGLKCLFFFSNRVFIHTHHMFLVWKQPRLVCGGDIFHTGNNSWCDFFSDNMVEAAAAILNYHFGGIFAAFWWLLFSREALHCTDDKKFQEDGKLKKVEEALKSLS